jgi:hypothetical protein
MLNLFGTSNLSNNRLGCPTYRAPLPRVSCSGNYIAGCLDLCGADQNPQPWAAWVSTPAPNPTLLLPPWPPAAPKVCYELPWYRSLYDNRASVPYNMTSMDLLLPPQLPNGGLRKGFLALIHPGYFGGGFRTQSQFTIRMNWWVSSNQNIQRIYLLDLNPHQSPPTGSVTWSTPSPFTALVRCSKDTVTDSFREVTFDKGVMTLSNTNSETWLFFDMGPASNTSVTTARLDYSSFSSPPQSTALFVVPNHRVLV